MRHTRACLEYCSQVGHDLTYCICGAAEFADDIGDEMSAVCEYMGMGRKERARNGRAFAKRAGRLVKFSESIRTDIADGFSRWVKEQEVADKFPRAQRDHGQSHAPLTQTPPAQQQAGKGESSNKGHPEVAKTGKHSYLDANTTPHGTGATLNPNQAYRPRHFDQPAPKGVPKYIKKRWPMMSASERGIYLRRPA